MQSVLELLEEKRDFLENNAAFIFLEDYEEGKYIDEFYIEYLEEILDYDEECYYDYLDGLEVVGEELKNGIFIVSCQKIN